MERGRCERAFERYLRDRRLPYVRVDEARRALLPTGARLRLEEGAREGGSEGRGAALKSFDFVVYGRERNWLIDIKGRRLTPRRDGARALGLQTWVTEDDVESLRVWERLFGAGFEAGFVFVYWSTRPLESEGFAETFEERFEDGDVWCALRAVRLSAYAQAMRRRSARWRTVHVPSAAFARISGPFAAA